MNCECGCGNSVETITKSRAWRRTVGQDAGYLPGHGLRGAKNPKWKGGRWIDQRGYVYTRAPGHPNARNNGYILEHRLVMSQSLGRALTPEDIVHHINGDKLDNRLENLEVTTRSAHGDMHQPPGPTNPQYLPRIPKKCLRCGTEFVASHGNHPRNRFCSTDCSRRLSGEDAWAAKLTDEQVRAIRALAGTLAQRKIAALFSCSKTQIGRILRGEAR